MAYVLLARDVSMCPQQADISLAPICFSHNQQADISLAPICFSRDLHADISLAPICFSRDLHADISLGMSVSFVFLPAR
ncbi:hypothetical protein CY34DRAFT_17924 [Suillus luteus UH-Slu-Lm8-n1]|uniref:Uncharacterized protein n=1 Tax=Suillus luteus UH-Slu-Lm8-n1 TaxID=930992 RepID=A0A0D0AQ86_9AGAM|nr:hypothetical protein CY34DRAFT_17924 [Suillus luteus UH-Slu-Lm8-n1]